MTSEERARQAMTDLEKEHLSPQKSDRDVLMTILKTAMMKDFYHRYDKYYK